MTKKEMEQLVQIFEVMLDRKLEEKLEAKFEEKLRPIYERLDRLEERVTRLEERMTRLEERVDKLEERMNTLEMDVRLVRVQMENQMLPFIKEIHAVYVSAYTRYADNAERMENTYQDIDVMKDVIARHSQQLQSMAG